MSQGPFLMANYVATKKIEALENRVKKLEEQVARLNRLISPSDAADLFEPSFEPTLKPQFGRRPKLDREHLRIQYEDLSRMLEAYWKALRPIFRKRLPKEKLKEELQTVFQRSGPTLGNYRSLANHLIEHSDVIYEFIRTPRFGDDPEKLAAALAGVPNISWSTSLKLCRSNTGV